MSEHNSSVFATSYRPTYRCEARIAFPTLNKTILLSKANPKLCQRIADDLRFMTIHKKINVMNPPLWRCTWKERRVRVSVTLRSRERVIKPAYVIRGDFSQINLKCLRDKLSKLHLIIRAWLTHQNIFEIKVVKIFLAWTINLFLPSHRLPNRQLAHCFEPSKYFLSSL